MTRPPQFSLDPIAATTPRLRPTPGPKGCLEDDPELPPARQDPPPRPGVTALARIVAAIALACLAQAGRARADIVLDFENNPNLPAQLNNFAAAGPMQTYSQAGVYSITGGVALGNPSFLAAFAAHGSAPNLYGTADFADPSLLATITLTLPSTELATAVSGVFFNGQPDAESYVLTAFSGGSTVGTRTITLAGSSSTSDFYNFSFTSTASVPITSVTFTTPNAVTNGYDFFVDSIHIVPGTLSAVPEPASLILLGQVGVVGLAVARLRRRRIAA